MKKAEKIDTVFSKAEVFYYLRTAAREYKYTLTNIICVHYIGSHGKES